ncbi:arylsulfatase [Rhodopirellula halodulae]|uniref:arylsulfatase n=1 Tax=Rhodopirellula halodulae TaxID=2894198 RepID=UPI001E575242|nr:arylsulfatase [Rhodopirellula sp. JC737]MCC9655441.1 arylsulfatase [Rhodopirellula sp. JC737]
MPHHQLRSLVGCLLAHALLLNSHAIAADSPFAKSPNVIVVMTDDQGYGDFSFNHNPFIRTPHLDRLASESVQLTDFHVAPMCTPTRGQLMSGLDAFRNAAINVSSGRTLLRHDLKTMADVFQESGYRTGLFGKWHLGDNYPFRPEDRGFEEALWFPSSHINSVPDHWDNDYFDDTYIHNGQRQTYSGYCTDVFFDEAIRWAKNDTQPFFAYIALNSAHWPWFVPDRYRDRVREMIGDDETLRHTMETKPAQYEDLISFLAMGINIDDNVGKLTHFLDQSGLADNTIVVFLTDNGSTFGLHYFNAGMRGKKTQLWEGGHRVPCLIRWPNKIQPAEIDDLTHVQDLLPTLADLSGCRDNLPEALDGTSLADRITGKVDSIEDRMLVINYSRMPQFKVTYTKGNPAIPRKHGAAVLWKKWRLLENRRLYHVGRDLHQDHNVAADHPEVVSKMRTHLDQWWDGVKDDVMKPERVVIGHENENPSLLTACEWLDIFVDQQVQIRRGVRKNGVWHLIVDQPGTYQFELRRWPKESGLKLDQAIPLKQVTDGTFPAGEGLPIQSGRLRIGDFDQTSPVDSSGQSITFRTQLSAGPIEMQTWMLDQDGNSICGAYYVDVHRLPNTNP